MQRFTMILMLLALVAAAGCDQAQTTDPAVPVVPELKPSFRLSSNTREAVVLEARYALRPQIWGPYKSLHDNAVSEWRYLTSDMAAYHKLKQPDWYGDNSSNWGMFWADPYQYALYGGYGRGGQCVYFANLILYRSGVYKAKPIPSYEKCRLDLEKSQNFTKPAHRSVPGDILRTKRGVPNHTAIAVLVLEGTPGKTASVVDVIDSNFIGNEIIGMHALSSDGKSTRSVHDLDDYFAVDLYKMGAR